MSGDRLAGKVALVTGAAHGIGAAIATRFAAEGAHVVLADVDEAGVRSRAAELTGAAGAGGSTDAVRLDVAEEEQWAEALEVVTERHGGLDVLVNNAGIVHHSPIESLALADYERSIRVNQIGTFLGIRSAVGPMRARGGGSIVNMSSVRGLVGGTELAAYASTKFAVTGLTKVAALELGPDGIRVNAIHPGGVATRLAAGVDEETQARFFANQPIARMGRPEEIAALALFLASDESSFCTGASFVADGGGTAGERRRR